MVTAAKSVQRGFWRRKNLRRWKRKKEDKCDLRRSKQNLEPRRARRSTKKFVRRFPFVALRVLDGYGFGSFPSESRFGGNGAGDLYLRFALRLSNESGARTFHAQAYIPTQPAQAIEDTRISHAHEDPGRQEGNFPPARQRA